MNIIEKLKIKNVTIGIEYYGLEDMATGIMVGQVINNNEEILSHFINTKLDTIDDYIDYLFIETISNLKEALPLIIEEKKIEFNDIIINIEKIRKNYTIKDINNFIKNNYEVIYKYEETTDLFIEHELKVHTTNHIGEHFSSFDKDESIIKYIMDNRIYEVIDNFDIWKKYFLKHIDKINLFLNEKNISEFINLRFKDLCNILENLNKNDKFKDIVKDSIKIIYDIITTMYGTSEKKVDKDIWMSYFMISDLINFLQKMSSPYAYQLEKIFSQTEEVFEDNLIKNGQSTEIKYDLKPFIDMLDNKDIPWELKTAYITHSKDSNKMLKSFLEHGAKCDVKALTDDLCKTTIKNSEYFTSWRLRNLDLYTFEIKCRVLCLVREKERLEEYLSSMCGELNLILENLNSTIKLERFDSDMDMLAQFLADIFINFRNNESMNKTTIKNNIYGCAMLICGMIEKTLRIIYKYNIKDISYISDSSITLGTTLKLKDNNTKIIFDILGEEQLTCLRYMLHKTEKEYVGKNIRNDLAHFNGKTIQNLSEDLILELLSYLSSILTSCVIYYQKNKLN